MQEWHIYISDILSPYPPPPTVTPCYSQASAASIRNNATPLLAAHVTSPSDSQQERREFMSMSIVRTLKQFNNTKIQEKFPIVESNAILCSSILFDLVLTDYSHVLKCINTCNTLVISNGNHQVCGMELQSLAVSLFFFFSLVFYVSRNEFWQRLGFEKLSWKGRLWGEGDTLADHTLRNPATLSALKCHGCDRLFHQQGEAAVAVWQQQLVCHTRRLEAQKFWPIRAFSSDNLYSMQLSFSFSSKPAPRTTIAVAAEGFSSTFDGLIKCQKPWPLIKNKTNGTFFVVCKTMCAASTWGQQQWLAKSWNPARNGGALECRGDCLSQIKLSSAPCMTPSTWDEDEILFQGSWQLFPGWVLWPCCPLSPLLLVWLKTGTCSGQLQRKTRATEVLQV